MKSEDGILARRSECKRKKYFLYIFEKNEVNFHFATIDENDVDSEEKYNKMQFLYFQTKNIHFP